MPFDPRVHVGVSAAIIDHSKRLLLIERKGAHGAGTWALPGGWVDFGESPEQAVKRELAEELGLITPDDPVLLDVIATNFPPPIDTAVTICYGFSYETMGVTQPPEIREPDKIAGWDWCPVLELPLMNLFAPLNTLLFERPGSLLNSLLGTELQR